jgi:NitT/TauT family transport system substrate-binding protein
MTYEPYLSTVRAKPAVAGKIMATTLDYPDGDGHRGLRPQVPGSRPTPRPPQALANSYFEALDMIKADPAKSNEIMGAAVKQTGEQFAKSSSFLRWQDRAANQKFFAGELPAFMKDAAGHPAGGRHHPQGAEDLNVTFDASFIK